MARRHKRTKISGYSCPVSPERQARLERTHSRDPMRRWAEETGIADRLLELIVAMVKEWKGMPTDPKTWRVECHPEESQEPRH